MSSSERIFIIDDNEDRCEKLHTIFDFIGQPLEISKFASWQIITNSTPSIIILGAHSSLDKTLDELDSLVKHFPKTPVLLIDEQLKETTICKSQCSGMSYVSF